MFPNFTMRGSMPSFGSLGAGMMQGGASPQNVAAMFPQFMTPNSGMSGPQYGRSPPSWQNDWAMTPQGAGVPLPAGIGNWQPAADFAPPPAAGAPDAGNGGAAPQQPAGVPPTPGEMTPEQLQAYYDQMMGSGGNASGGWQ